MSEKDKYKTFVWEYFDRGISKSYKEVTDAENCADVIKCTGGSTRGLHQHLKRKHSTEKPRSTQSDVIIAIHNLLVLQSISSVLILNLHCSLMNKKTREEIVAKLVTVYGFHPRTVC